ncbi:MAG: histidinol-phosphate transaminase [Acidobacteriota bacterium]|nr:histidinol-phosphate transaminase [Acidobacteriota bacterium]
MQKSSIQQLLPAWLSRIRPYPAGKPIEEVERELGIKAIKLASNENPMGPSPRAVEAIRQAASRIHLYPDSAGRDLTETLARRYGLEPNQIILGAGSTELIELAAKTFLSAGDEGISSEFAFHIYQIAIQETGATLTLVPTRDMALDLAAIRRAVTGRTRIIFLGNPNNPTGTMFSAREFDEFLGSLPAHVLAVLDEAYFDYVQRPDYSHSRDYALSGRNVLVLRTFSKVYGLAGMRLGYGFGPTPLIEALNRVRMPFNTSRLAQAGAIAALGDSEYVARSVEMNAREMRFVSQELTLLGLRFTPSAANFVLIDTARDCEEDFLRLLQEGVIVRPMKVYGLPTSLRVTIGTHEDNERFLEALHRICAAAAPERGCL